MSKKNRLMVYNKLLLEGRLSQDDGALEAEFGSDKPKPLKDVVKKEKEKKE